MKKLLNKRWKINSLNYFFCKTSLTHLFNKLREIIYLGSNILILYIYIIVWVIIFSSYNIRMLSFYWFNFWWLWIAVSIFSLNYSILTDFFSCKTIITMTIMIFNYRMSSIRCNILSKWICKFSCCLTRSIFVTMRFSHTIVTWGNFLSIWILIIYSNILL